MYAMQCSIGLPADYDMEIIRKRVMNAGPALGSFPGLGLKAYLIREAGVDGSPVDAYAPFYIWSKIAGTSHVLSGGGFDRIIASFGRPVVRDWMGLDFRTGLAPHPEPTRASIVRTALPSLSHRLHAPIAPARPMSIRLRSRSIRRHGSWSASPCGAPQPGWMRPRLSGPSSVVAAHGRPTSVERHRLNGRPEQAGSPEAVR